MKHFQKIRKTIALLLFICIAMSFVPEEKIKIVLIGDSTTIGNLPRTIHPNRPQLEGMLQFLLNIEEGIPKTEVINLGKGGETAIRLLESGRYKREIANIKDVDYIFVRLGINDWFQCDDVEKEFPIHLKAVLDHLKEDHPNAKIYPSTICQFMSNEKCEDVNRLIKKVAREEKLEVFDLYPAYHQFILTNGINSLNVRNFELDNLPKKYHKMLSTYVYTDWKKKKKIQVDDLHLDPLFGHLHGWYFDRHPNTAGYNLIAKETAEFLAPIIRRDLD